MTGSSEVDGAPDGSVPDWKLREFEGLKAAVASLWEQLEVPAEDVTAFLSECDLLAPYSPSVHAMYGDMYRRLTGQAAAAAPLPAPATAPHTAAAPAPAPVAAPAFVASRDDDEGDDDDTTVVPTPVSAAGGATVSSASYAPVRGAPNATATARGRASIGGPAAPAGFRSTGFAGGSGRNDDAAAAAYLAKQASRATAPPPSLGGPGSRRSPSPRAGGRR